MVNVLLGLLLLAIGAPVAVYGHFAAEVADHTYVGELAFDETADYQEFKEYVAREDVRLISSSELSSNPPIIVTYEIRAPAALGFGYAWESLEQHREGSAADTAVFILGVLVGAFGVALVFNEWVETW